MRVGTGYDVHRLCDDREMVIGGVKIDYEKGLLGHSDALLGAAALGDIGKHFPDTDDKYKGISSLILLKEVGNLLTDNGFYINNIDATIIAQAPKMRPYIDEMRENIANTLQLDISQINVKATTEEGLGFTGSKEGIAAQAVCLLSEANEMASAMMNSGCEYCGGCSRQ